MSRALSATPAAVTASGWGWRHAGRSDWAIRELDLRIEPGERVLLLGASGAGKSTLLRGLAGVLGGDDDGEQTGRLRVDGIDPVDARGRVGLLQQDPDAQLVLARLGDDVAFGCENLGVPADEIWRRVPEALADVGLRLPLDRSTSELSGGQKQRAALAGLLAMGPGLLLLDEPTANLDPDGARQVVEAVRDLLASASRTLIVVEHRVEVWLDLIDRVVVLASDGGLLAEGSPDEVFRVHRDTLLAAGVWVPGWHAEARRPTDAPSEPLLDAVGVSVARVRGVPVLSGVDLAVHSSRALAITGPNGAGKSTLALALGGLTAPTAGSVAASADLASGLRPEPRRWTSRQLLTRIGSVFQDPEHQFLTGRVRAELELGPRLAGEGGARIGTDELLARLRLDGLADANPFTLSGGQKRRLSVATALATGPRVLVLDEPTFGQDLRTWRELVALLDDLRSEGAAIVAVSHDEPFVAAIADDVLALPAREEDIA